MQAFIYGVSEPGNDVYACGPGVWGLMRSEGMTEGDLHAMGYYLSVFAPADTVLVMCGKLRTWRAILAKAQADRAANASK